MHNIKEIRKDFKSFQELIQKRNIKVDIDNIKEMEDSRTAADAKKSQQLMEKGAICTTISGNGPSIMAITDKKNKSRVEKEFSGLDGKIMLANINNKKAYVHEL